MTIAADEHSREDKEDATAIKIGDKPVCGPHWPASLVGGWGPGSMGNSVSKTKVEKKQWKAPIVGLWAPRPQYKSTFMHTRRTHIHTNTKYTDTHKTHMSTHTQNTHAHTLKNDVQLFVQKWLSISPGIC